MVKLPTFIQTVQSSIKSDNLYSYQIFRLVELFSFITANPKIPPPNAFNRIGILTNNRYIHVEWVSFSKTVWINILPDHTTWGYYSSSSENAWFGPIQEIGIDFKSHLLEL